MISLDISFRLNVELIDRRHIIWQLKTFVWEHLIIQLPEISPLAGILLKLGLFQVSLCDVLTGLNFGQKRFSIHVANSSIVVFSRIQVQTVLLRHVLGSCARRCRLHSV